MHCKGAQFFYMGRLFNKYDIIFMYYLEDSMKDSILTIINQYLLLFPEEKQRQAKLVNFLNNFDDNEIIDWNNFNGHIVASGFVYSKNDKKFLVMYHNDMKMYTYPGGHIDLCDANPLVAAIREVKEETGLMDFEEVNIARNELVPVDIDTHIISYNERLNLPQHYHFDFRYLFIIDKILNVKVDGTELSNYKWINIDELSSDPNYGKIVEKLRRLL